MHLTVFIADGVFSVQQTRNFVRGPWVKSQILNISTNTHFLLNNSTEVESELCHWSSIIKILWYMTVAMVYRLYYIYTMYHGTVGKKKPIVPLWYFLYHLCCRWENDGKNEGTCTWEVVGLSDSGTVLRWLRSHASLCLPWAISAHSHIHTVCPILPPPCNFSSLPSHPLSVSLIPLYFPL